MVSVAIASERVLDHFHTCLRLRAFGNNFIQTVTMPVTTLLKSLLFRVNRCPKRSKAAPKDVDKEAPRMIKVTFTTFLFGTNCGKSALKILSALYRI